MKENDLVSSYTIAQFKPQKSPTNEAKTMNHLNREFNQKDAQLVYQALATIKTDLTNIKVFHTDSGNEFDNHLIDDVLSTFSIQRSLSNKRTPYGNAVAEAMFKVFK